MQTINSTIRSLTYRTQSLLTDNLTTKDLAK